MGHCLNGYCIIISSSQIAASPPPRPPMHFGIPEEVTELEAHFPIHPHLEGLEYVLVQSTVWVDVGKDTLRPHEY